MSHNRRSATDLSALVRDEDRPDFPNADPVDLTVEQFGKQIKLKSYHYPVPAPYTRKGIVFHIHGYG